jgi:hypothetical protein
LAKAGSIWTREVLHVTAVSKPKLELRMGSSVPVQPRLVLFWPKYHGKSGDWYPLIAHGLETGAVSRILIERSLSPDCLCSVARALELDEAETLDLVVSLAVVHDIGKMNPGFQHQIEWFRDQLQAQGFAAPDRTLSPPHRVGRRAQPTALVGAGS